MKKLILCASVVCLGMFSSCSKDELVPADEKPEWLGSSIYEELRGGTHLTGTFNTYLRLVDELGYAEVLGRTGSKTIFPANDEAFARFFASDNLFGVSSYDQLTVAQKKQLLYTSMLDNAMLTGMLSNVENGSNNVSRGVAIKHETNLAVADHITTLYNGAQMPQNNTYWDNYRTKGINLVYDGTKSMLVHFTTDQMLLNNITYEGKDCDFGILRGEPVGTSLPADEPAYIFQNRIISQNSVCTNGYIHQVQDVIVPPGNMGEVLRREANTQLFSRILDYHCAPYYDAQTTLNYNSWAVQNGVPTIDSVFQVRYFAAARSQGGQANTSDPSGNSVQATRRLVFDPGWNQYYPSSDSKKALADMGAILVPTDEAIKEYFLPGGVGAYFLDLYGVEGLPKTEENLPLHLDALFNNGNGILTTFVNNLMQNSFVASVPSKFSTLTQAGSGDFMDITKDILALKGNKYDVVVANNGIIYKIKSMIAPDEYQSVIGPVSVYPDMSVMKYFVQDKTEGSRNSIFGVDLYYYLMAMKANYALFAPSNTGLNGCIIDVVSLGKAKPGVKAQAMAFYDYEEEVPGTTRRNTYYGARVYEFDPATGDIGAQIGDIKKIVSSSSTTDYKSQVGDLLNYSTIVLKAGEEFGLNHYYLTKNGGAIRIDDYTKGYDSKGELTFSGTVRGGAQIDLNMAPAKIEKGWIEKNGVTFQTDGVIQPSITSVHSLMSANPQFSSFIELCTIFDDTDLLDWAGISSEPIIPGSSTTMQTKFKVFSDKSGKALDMNVNFFNGYNYTFFAPNNDAVEYAYDNMGLPREAEVRELYEAYQGLQPGDIGPSGQPITEGELEDAKAITLSKIIALRAFVRYHFMNNSVFADNNVPSMTYQSMYSTSLGIPVNLKVRGGGGILEVVDEQGNTFTINANGSTGLANKMLRDIEYDDKKESAKAVALSSFASLHEVSKPLCYNKSGRYDTDWASDPAKKLTSMKYAKTLLSIKNLKD